MGRMEIITGRERRRRWTDEEKLSILEEAARPGRSAAAVARQHDILPQQLYAWRRRYRRTGPMVEDAVSFLPVELVSGGLSEPVNLEKPAKPRREPGCRVEIRCRNGRVLKVDPETQADALRRLIRVVEEA